VTADDQSFDSGALAPGRTYSRLFDTATTVSFHCNIHPAMKGSLIIK
jgi:plastocyanin